MVYEIVTILIGSIHVPFAAIKPKEQVKENRFNNVFRTSIKVSHEAKWLGEKMKSFKNIAYLGKIV